MPAPRFVMPTEETGQSAKRSIAVFFDQHKTPDHPEGRPWWGWAEAPTNPKLNKGIVGEMLPVTATMQLEDGTVIKGWDAPWLPEAKYIQASVSSIAGNRFKINYPAQIADYRTANERYYRKANEEAMARNLPAVRMYGPVPFAIRAIKDVGDPPKSPKVPEAALAGDTWILFGAGNNEQLKDILDRDNGRMREALEEGDSTVEENPLAGFTADELTELRALLGKKKASKAPV